MREEAMRIIFITVIGLHGLIHLFGFLKAFDLSDFSGISQPVSRQLGVIWLLTFVLFAVVDFLLLARSNYWWIIGMIAVLLSQFLIIMYWKDAKFGTVVNLAVLVSALLACSAYF